MGVNNNKFINIDKSSFNTTNNESVEGITEELFKILNDSDSEMLSMENKSRISSVFSNILGNKSLQNEESTLVPLLDRVCQDFKKEDVRKIFIACLKKCPDAMISSVLKLDAWKNSFTHNIDDQSLKTNAEKACERIIACFKNNEDILILNDLRLPFLPDIAFTYLTHLKKLNIANNELTFLPNEVCSLTNLTELSCFRNQLTSLPTAIGQLSQLQLLACAHNQLTSLPTAIGQLSQLKNLYCFYNRLTSLPTEIGQLSQLKELDCYNNQLTSLPIEIGQLSQLKKLGCVKNQLTSLPTEIGQLSRLRALDCSDNQLQTIPDALGALNLDSFSCYSNFLTTLPDALLSRFALGNQRTNHTQSSYTPNNNNTPVPSNGLDAFKQATQDPSLKKLDTSFLNSSDHPGLSANVLQWLDKLRTAQEFKNEKTRPLFATQVLSILQFAKNNPEYLETLKAQLVDVLSSCVDRAASPINYLEFQKMVLESKDGSIENFMKLLKSGLALEVLDKFAKEFMKQHPHADEIEVYLGLKMKLKDVLGLPTLGSMNFYACSDLEDKDLVKAEALVRDAWDNMELLTSYFLSQDVWIDKLKTAYRIELDAHLEPVNEKLEQLTEEADKLTSDDFKKKTDLLLLDHKRLEKEWLRTKTIELLKTASSTKGEGKQEIQSPMETLIGILRNSATLKSAELIKTVASLDSPVLGKVYYHVYDMAKKNNMNTNHVDFGKVAFCKQDGFDVPDVLRLKAIQKGILDELADMLKKGKRNGVLALISKLPVDIENRIYGEVYFIEKKNGKDVSHWDFGRAAFHQQDGKDVTDDIRIVALRNVSDQI